MKKLAEILELIENLNVPMLTKQKLALATDVEREYEDGVCSPEYYNELLKVWNDFYNDIISSPQEEKLPFEDAAFQDFVASLPQDIPKEVIDKAMKKAKSAFLEEEAPEESAKEKEDVCENIFDLFGNYPKEEFPKKEWDEKEELPTTYSYCGYDNLELKIYAYQTTDFMGQDKRVLAIVLENKEVEIYVTTCFGEFIGQISTTYVNTNNNPNIEDFLFANHIGIKTAFTKRSGFCEYPLFIINPRLVEKFAVGFTVEEYIADFDYGMEELPSLKELVRGFYSLGKEVAAKA